MVTLVIHAMWALVVVYVTTLAAHMVREGRNAKAHSSPVALDIPEDLVAVANQEREAWAQEETLRAIRERFDTLRDWNLVRSAFGVGRRE